MDAKNWVQTSKGKAFLVALRLYGVGTEFYDQTWKPDDVVKISGIGSRLRVVTIPSLPWPLLVGPLS